MSIGIGTWDAPLGQGQISKELCVHFDQARENRVLILPAWFDEANKLRRFTIETMRLLNEAGIDTVLPDLPGCNESLAPLGERTIASWRDAVEAAQAKFAPTHILSIRAGALLAPDGLPGWRYAPQTGAKLLRAMMRARIVAAREAGRAETTEGLFEQARAKGLILGGWPLGAAMIAELENAEPLPSASQRDVAASELGSSGLWLRAEPDEDADQSQALTQIIAADVGTGE
ncbi:MAG: hypothetical protein ABJP70_09625 [Erythrobacter sp.]